MSMETVYRPAGERCHFYASDGTPVWEVPNKSKGGMRKVTLSDAKKLDLLPSITTAIQGGRPTPYGIIRNKIEQFGQHLLTATRQPEESDAVFLDRVNEEYQEAMDAAPDLGTAVHAALAAYLRGQPVSCPPEAQAAYQKAVNWLEPRLVDAELIEKPLADLDAGYAGTLDAVLIMQGGLRWLIDWKTQAVKDKPRTYDEWVIQLAAQRAMLSDKIDVVANIIIPTTDYPEITEVGWGPDDLAWGERAFFLALDTYRHDNRFPLRVAA